MAYAREGDTNRATTESKRAGRLAATLGEKLAAQKRVNSLEQQRDRKRRDPFDAQDAVTDKCEEMITKIERQLGASETTQRLFTIRWRLT